MAYKDSVKVLLVGDEVDCQKEFLIDLFGQDRVKEPSHPPSKNKLGDATTIIRDDYQSDPTRLKNLIWMN